MRLAEGEDAVALAGLGVEADVVAEAGAAAAGDAEAEAAGVGRDAFLGHGDADALEGADGELDGLAAADWPSAVRTGDGGAAGTVGAATAPLGVSVWRVTMDIMRCVFCGDGFSRESLWA